MFTYILTLYQFCCGNLLKPLAHSNTLLLFFCGSVCVLCLSAGPAETLSRGNQACQKCHFQSIHVWFLPRGSDGAAEGAISRPPAALGADPSLWGGSGSQWRPNRRHLQVSENGNARLEKQLFMEKDRRLHNLTTGIKDKTRKTEDRKLYSSCCKVIWPHIHTQGFPRWPCTHISVFKGLFKRSQWYIITFLSSL